jgi:hypothetical protein
MGISHLAVDMTYANTRVAVPTELDPQYVMAICCNAEAKSRTHASNTQPGGKVRNLYD